MVPTIFLQSFLCVSKPSFPALPCIVGGDPCKLLSLVSLPNGLREFQPKWEGGGKRDLGHFLPSFSVKGSASLPVVPVFSLGNPCHHSGSSWMALFLRCNNVISLSVCLPVHSSVHLSIHLSLTLFLSHISPSLRCGSDFQMLLLSSLIMFPQLTIQFFQHLYNLLPTNEILLLNCLTKVPISRQSIDKSTYFISIL